MKSHNKKMFTLLAVVLMVNMLFAGCGKSGSDVQVDDERAGDIQLSQAENEEMVISNEAEQTSGEESLPALETSYLTDDMYAQATAFKEANLLPLFLNSKKRITPATTSAVPITQPLFAIRFKTAAETVLRAA